MEKAFLTLNEKWIYFYHVKIKHFYMAKTTIVKSRDKWQAREKYNHSMVKEPISLIYKMFLQNNKKDKEVSYEVNSLQNSKFKKLTHNKENAK